MATIEGIEGLHKGRKGSLRPGRVSVGSGIASSLSIPDDPALSKRHAILFFEDGAWFLKDEGSLTGTFLDGKRLGKVPVFIPNGGILRFGNQKYRVVYARGELNPLRALPPQLQGSLKLSGQAEIASPTPRAIPPKGEDSYQWHGIGATVEINGFLLKDPLVYVGTALASRYPKGSIRHGSYDQEEVSLINPNLPVNPAETKDELPYYPTYFQMMPRQRGAYLRWLADGRRTDVPERYVCLFTYGLERRLIWRGGIPPAPEEVTVLLDELEALCRRYPAYGSLRSNATRLLASHWARYPERVAFDLIESENPHGVGPRFPFALGCLVNHKFTETHARQWLANERNKLAKKLVGSRCWPELCALFAERIGKEIGDGIKLHPSHDLVGYPKWTTNSSLRHEGFPDTTVKAAAETSRIHEKLVSVSQACITALDPVAKRLGHNPAEGDRRRAQLFLPDELRPDSAVAAAVETEMTVIAAQDEPVHWIEFFRLIGIGDERLRKNEYVLFDLIASLGFILEPDPRKGLVPVDKAATFVAKKVEGESAPPSVQLRTAQLICWLTAHTLGHGQSLTHVAIDSLAKQFQVASPERERLDAFALWARGEVPKPSKTPIEGLKPEYRVTASRALITLTRSGQGNPVVVKELTRILGAWGWGERDVFSAIHADDDELVTITPSVQESKYAIPTAPVIEPPKPQPVSLDMAKVRAKMVETEAVSKILWDVFTEEEPEILPSPPQPAKQNLGPLETILFSLKEGEMESAEFGRLVGDAGLLVGATVEALNDLAFERCDAALLEGDGPYWIDAEILDELRNGFRENQTP